MPEFVRWEPADADALVELLTGEDWPWHAAGRPDPAAVLERATEPGSETHWIVLDGVRVGMVRLFDLGEDEEPMFDLRLRAAYRGRGLGTAAVRWLTTHLYGTLPGIHRIEATTRSDNWAMRRVLESCGYQQEAYYREAWPVPGGDRLDAVGYAILRTEWEGSPDRTS